MSTTAKITRAAVKQLNTQDSLLLNQVLQKVKPQIMAEEEMWTITSNRLLYLKKNKITTTNEKADPDAVFNSLLHRSASVSTKNHRMNYEENFNNIYN